MTSVHYAVMQCKAYGCGVILQDCRMSDVLLVLFVLLMTALGVILFIGMCKEYK